MLLPLEDVQFFGSLPRKLALLGVLLLGTLDYFIPQSQIIQGMCILPQASLNLSQWQTMTIKQKKVDPKSSNHTFDLDVPRLFPNNKDIKNHSRIHVTDALQPNHSSQGFRHEKSVSYFLQKKTRVSFWGFSLEEESQKFETLTPKGIYKSPCGLK